MVLLLIFDVAGVVYEEGKRRRGEEEHYVRKEESEDWKPKARTPIERDGEQSRTKGACQWAFFLFRNPNGKNGLINYPKTHQTLAKQPKKSRFGR